MRKTIIILIHLFLANIIIAQETVKIDMNTINQAALNIQRSPDVAAMERYGTYPVNLCTGVPDISIPIYMIEAGSLTYPISLSYHLGGIRVNDVASSAGLGWTLNALSHISRTIKGIADDHQDHGFLQKVETSLPSVKGGVIKGVIPFDQDRWNLVKDGNKSNPQTEDIWFSNKDYFEKIRDGYLDGESDLYNFQFNGVSGSFFYDLNRNLIQNPYSENRIVSDYKNGYIITDTQGNKYYFRSEDTEYIQSRNPGWASNWKPNTGISSWLLSEIISADNTDTITFTYSSPHAYYEINENITLWEGYTWETVNTHNGENSKAHKYFRQGISHDSSTTIEKKERLLSSIKFKTGSIIFEYSDARKDQRKFQLISIVVYSKINNQRIKKVTFDQSYYPTKYTKKNMGYRLKLNSIRICGVTDENPQIYKFSYNEQSDFPPYQNRYYYSDVDYRILHKGQDHWGFFNGVKNNESLVAYVSKTSVIKSSIANREPNESFMKACSLERIDYPTGGYSIFETEANRDYLGKLVGGLRISKIKSNTGVQASESNVTTFQYENPEYIYNPSPSNYYYTTYNVKGDLYMLDGNYDVIKDAPMNYYTENPITPVGYYSGSPIMYKKVTKYEGDFNNNLNQGYVLGKSVSCFNDPILYTALIFGTGQQDYNGSVGYKDNRLEFIIEPISWASCKINKEEYYKSDGKHVPNFIKIKEKIYEYKQDMSREYTIGLSVYNRYNFTGAEKQPYTDGIARDLYDYYWMRSFTGFILLSKTKEIDYFPLKMEPSRNDSIVKIEKYNYKDLYEFEYNDIKSLLLSDKTVDTGDDIIKTEYYYTKDFAGSVDEQTPYSKTYREMYWLNMENILLEEITYKNSKKIDHKKIEYAAFPAKGNNLQMYKPYSFASAHNSKSPLREDIVYNKYNIYGNLEQYTTTDGVSTVLIWSYLGKYPIAEIKNATYNDVQMALAAQGKTSNQLLLTYKPDLNDDLLRTMLAQSQVSTFVYDLNIGLVKITNPNGSIQHFDYDFHNRLKSVMVEDYGVNRLLNSYEYHYK